MTEHFYHGWSIRLSRGDIWRAEVLSPSDDVRANLTGKDENGVLKRAIDFVDTWVPSLALGQEAKTLQR